jgi:hypothetical protein
MKTKIHIMGINDDLISRSLTNPTGEVYLYMRFDPGFNGTMDVLDSSLDFSMADLSSHPIPINYTTAAADTSGTGTIAWANPTNATGATADTNYATATLLALEVSRYLKCTGFGFAIPTDATITGIEVLGDVDADVTSGSPQIEDNSIKLVKGGTISGNDNAGQAWPSTPGQLTWGSSTDLWGLSWTGADINASTFGVAISAKETNNFPGVAKVDRVQIKVYYSFPLTRLWEIKPRGAASWETLDSKVLPWVAGGLPGVVKYEGVKSSFTTATVPFDLRLSFTATGSSEISVSVEDDDCIMRSFGNTAD